MALAIEMADAVGMGAPTAVETGIVLTARMGPAGGGVLERFLAVAEVVVVPFGDGHWREALGAFVRYGRGRHPARLNLGDCFSYATARLAAQPLLCIGDDFPRTDLDLVQPAAQ
ncbi:MAG: type II toxin-antitoxin system VapC family toxin [Angustibacter sp.]